MFEGICMDVLRNLQECFLRASKVLKRKFQKYLCLKKVLRIFHGRCSLVFQGSSMCFSEVHQVFRGFQECFKEVMFCNFVVA